MEINVDEYKCINGYDPLHTHTEWEREQEKVLLGTSVLILVGKRKEQSEKTDSLSCVRNMFSVTINYKYHAWIYSVFILMC